MTAYEQYAEYIKEDIEYLQQEKSYQDTLKQAEKVKRTTEGK